MSSMVTTPSLLALMLSATVPVIETKPAFFHSSRAKAARTETEAFDPRARSAVRLPPSAHHALPALSAAERVELSSKDSRGGLRRKQPAEKVGIERFLPTRAGFAGVPLDLAAGTSLAAGGGLFERSADGRLTWTASFSSEGAGALRLHFSSASLPPGTQVYVYAASGEAHGPYLFDRPLRPEGFWTNTVFSSRMFLEVRFPAGAAAGFGVPRLSIPALVHLEHEGFAPGSGQGTFRAKAQECFVDAACVTPAEFPAIDDAKYGVAQLTFVDGGGAFVCTGGLLNTTSGSFVPYLLTANHCFANQAAATSLETVWQYWRSTCNGPEPPPFGFPRRLGSTLRATGAVSDFTLVELDEDPPDGSLFFGWTTADVTRSNGMTLYRLSHPDGRPQFFTEEEITANPTPVVCSDAPQGPYLYERDVVGGTGGGSSGSPLYLGNLKVVGQLGGACGLNPGNDCAVQENSSIDGAFHASFPSLQPFLSPGPPGTCTQDATTLCLNGGRFEVQVSFETDEGELGDGQAEPLTSDSGYFWFFNAANIELVVKVLDGCGSNQHFWVFSGGLTNVEVVMTVTDTETGGQKVYANPLGTAFLPLQDTSAFDCP
jgi:lysyl endopeptidase